MRQVLAVPTGAEDHDKMEDTAVTWRYPACTDNRGNPIQILKNDDDSEVTGHRNITDMDFLAAGANAEAIAADGRMLTALPDRC